MTEYDIQAGDDVRVRHIMGEPRPYWSDGWTATVVSVSGPSYAPKYEVRHHDKGEVVEVEETSTTTIDPA